MFHSKKSQVDFKKITQKFLDGKKDSRSRAHALRILLDNFETHEAKVFFQRHYSEIYYICHDYFSIVEVNLRQKANKSVREDLDGVLHILEKILILLPELVHDRWQFGSIGRTMQKLLHHGNAFKIRSDGIRLLILWLQALQDNMDILCEVMFACVVPGFPKPLSIIKTSDAPLHVLEEICNCLQGRDKETVATHTTGSMTLLPQEAKEATCSSTWCTQDELQVLVPLINQTQTEKVPGLEDLTKVYLDRILDYMITQIAKIEWVDKNMRRKGFECLFNLFKKYYLHHVFPVWRPLTNLYATNPEDQVQEIADICTTSSVTNDLTKYADSVVKWFVAFTSKIKRVVKMQYGGDLVDLSHTSQSTESLGSSSTTTDQQQSGTDHSRAMYEDLIVAGNVIRDVIYSTRENVHIVHEVFRQSFLLPIEKSLIIKEVLAVYYNWLKNDSRPRFMEEAEDESDDDIRAGLQGNVRLLICHSAFVFITSPNGPTLDYQVEICKRIILMYRNIVLETPMQAKTWEQLLIVLLTIAGHVLKEKVVEPKRSSFAGRLAPTLLQTLFVTWIRANLSVTVSIELWDRFLDVISSLTHWSEVVFEWKSTMETLTSVIARRVYYLDLTDLPLDRLTEQKHKKRKHLQAGFKNITQQATPVQEAKPEATPPPSQPCTAVPSGGREHDQVIRENTADNLDASAESQQSESSEGTVKVKEEDPSSQVTIEQDSEKGYESDVTDSGSELSFETAEKSGGAVEGDTDMSLNSLLSTYESWASGGTVVAAQPEDDSESLGESSRKSEMDSSSRNDQTDDSPEVNKTRKKNHKKVRAFWKDSDGAEEASSDSEVPASFSNPIHDETSFENVTPVTTPMQEAHSVPLEIVDPPVQSSEVDNEVSVVCGGTKEGWSPVAAVALWCRVLGILGNINNIENATIHAQVLIALRQIWQLLAKIRLNQGISEDNKSTPSIPDLLPPLHHFSSWLFEATCLPQKYQPGRLIAYELLCSMTVRQHDNPLSDDYLRHFYQTLHYGLTGSDQETINAILSKCDTFFAMVLPSSSVLMLDFISAANTIIDCASVDYPRTEAVTILGSLLCYPNAFPNMNVYQIGTSSHGEQPAMTPCRDLKDKIVDALYKAARGDPDCHARCTALSAIGIFIVEELTHHKGHGRLHSYTSLLLTSIVFKNWSVSCVAIGLIRNLSEYHEELTHCDTDLPLKIIQVLCEIIRYCVEEGSFSDSSHGVKILNPLMSCILDWVMVIPLTALMKTADDNHSTLAQVFQALKFVVSNKSSTTAREFNISRMISRDDNQIHLGQIHQDNTGTCTGSVDLTDSDSANSRTSFQTMDRARKTAKAVILHIVNHLDHFPLSAGAARLTSIVNENQDNPYSAEEHELTPAVFASPNVQFFVLNDSSLLSFVELPRKSNAAGTDDSSRILSGNTTTRIIVRDMCGKHCLDVSTLFGPSTAATQHCSPGVLRSLFSDEELSEVLSSGLADTDYSRRKSTTETVNEPDKLDQLLKDIGTASPECLFYPHLCLNEPAPSPQPLDDEFEKALITAIETQQQHEKEFCERTGEEMSLQGSPLTPNDYHEPSNPFHLSHFLFNQLGMFGWEKRPKIDLLKKSDKLVRELKHLDNRKSRETHKIAVFYVAAGQEDKTSIMSNSSGSKEYEDFVAGLAWEIDLSSHTGFMGGLDKNQSTGNTAVYYANSTVEVMFHVATRMPVSADEGGFIKKVRHLGNDEIWIVWSEHSRDFRHGIVNAEFGDVVIAIYPLKNHLFRIQILKKGEIPYFGPLFNGAIVDRRILPSLVRMTAVNASRAKRSLIPGMQTYYEERASSINNIVNHHKQTTVFEDFAEQAFCPIPREASAEQPGLPFSFSAHLRHNITGDTAESAKREGYSTLPSTKITKERDLISATLSLPEGLHRVSLQSDASVGQKLERKRMSLRKKLGSSSKEDSSTSEQ